MAITKVVMPKLSEAMESGKLLRWLKREGDRVSGGDIIAEIETDKADIELEAFGAGVLRRLLVRPGASVPVGDLIAVIAEPDEDIDGVGGSAPEAPARTGVADPAPVAAGAHPAASTPLPGGRLRASPLARKRAQDAGVDLALVAGTGPGGRVIERDIEAYLASRLAAAPAVPVGRPAAPSPVRPVIGGPAEVRPAAETGDQPLSQIRAAIARQMVQSKGPVPHFYVTTEVAMDRAAALRAELQALAGAPKVTVTDLVVRAVTLGLVRHPAVNASFLGEAIRRHQGVHVGLAVALDEGLITSVLRDCDRKPLFQIAAEARDLVERTRARKLRAQELSGATFSVSNLGMFPVEEFAAIINPPEAAILAVGAILDKAVVVDGQLVVGKRMRLTLSCDHRVVDGAIAARFLADLKATLEAPLALLV